MKKINILIVLLMLSVSFSFAQETERYTIKHLEECNNQLSNFGTTFIGENQVIFSSPKEKTQIVKNIWTPNEQQYLELFIADINEEGELVNKVRINKEVNSKYHESNVAFNSLESIVYFTRDKFYSKKLDEDKRGMTHIAMYRAEVITPGVWMNIVEMPFNSPNYCVGHPTLSADDKTLYYSSELDGSHDIYSISINEDGTYGEPVKLGDRINTEHSERFPFIGENNTLYFSSDKPGGRGNLDIYAIKLDGRSEAINLGSPINSIADDFSFTQKKGKDYGYFSSNRISGNGDDDIYYFKEIEELPCEQYATGVVVNKKNGKKIPNALVVLYDEDGDEIDSQIVGRDAKFDFEIDCSSTYKVEASKEKYTNDSKTFTSNTELELDLTLTMDKGVKAVPVTYVSEPVTYVSEPVTTYTTYEESNSYYSCQEELDRVNNIYFVLNKHNITYEAATELNKVIVIMKKCQDIIITASSHTDCRASHEYNQRLSQRRAQATVNYIINTGGISSNRINAIGYGETRLVNRCQDGVKCSESEHQKNRRSQFDIINY